MGPRFLSSASNGSANGGVRKPSRCCKESASVGNLAVPPRRIVRATYLDSLEWETSDMPAKPMLADEALNKLVREHEFRTVLDIGCGDGPHFDVFQSAGKHVTGIDYRPRRPDVIAANYLQHTFDEPFDCVWASHVLEHQPNVQTFLHKIYSDLKVGGIL